MSKKRLVILTTHFGTNFSGGSTATCEIFSRIEDHFDGITVVGTMLGKHPFKSIDFKKYSTWIEAIHILRKLSSANSIYYGDFYNSIIFCWLNIPFYFTYHDNWPELGKTSFREKIRSIYFTNIYKAIFKSAIAVFSVSAFKTKFISRHCRYVHLVRNGFNRERLDPSKSTRSHVLMVGNIDNRKYKKALELFKNLETEWRNDIRVEIYGNVIDKGIANKLTRFQFVELKGFRPDVPYKDYRLLLHTSTMENLPIVYCEAIYNGLQVLGFDVGGAKEIISENQGKLIAPYKVEEMKAALILMMEETGQSHDYINLDEYSWDLASRSYLNKIAS